jgi:phage regulatory protein, rha family
MSEKILHFAIRQEEGAEGSLPLEQWVFAQGDTLKTDSRIVAKVFEKNHKEVLRDIRELRGKDTGFAERNFALCFENNPLQNGKALPYYEIAFDGFIMLVMGYQGEKAFAVKLRYINLFNEMREVIADYNYSVIAKLSKALEVEAISRLAGSLAGKALRRRRSEKVVNLAAIRALREQVQPDIFALLAED